METSNQEEINPKILVEQFEKGERQFDFYASFTEPFWTLYFIGNRVIFNQMDEDPHLYFSDSFFDSNENTQRIRFSNGDKDWTVIIEKGEGSDGMSDIIYPYSVIMNEKFQGGGGEEYC